jgi:hypothetical protein
MDVYLAGQCPAHTVFVVRGEVDLATADKLLKSPQDYLSSWLRRLGLDLSG